MRIIKHGTLNEIEITCENCDYSGSMTKIENSTYEIAGTLPGASWDQGKGIAL